MTETPTSSKTKHIWLLAGALVLQLLSATALLLLVLRNPHLGGKGWRLFIYPGVWVVTLSIEIAIYWNIRKGLKTMRYVWLHCGLVFFAFLLLPLLNLIVPLAASTHLSAERYEYISGLLGELRFYLFWGCMVVAHYFFTQTLIGSWFSTKQQPPDTGEEGDVLPEYPV